MTPTAEPQTGTILPSGFNIPWPFLSMMLGISAVTCLGTLAVVVSVKDVDSLSTIALALAILSFAAQLIVSLLQTASTAKINVSTESALAEMRATTESLLTNQRDQFNTVLKAALNVVPAAVEEVAGSASPDETDDSSGGETQTSLVSLADNISNRLRHLMDQPVTTLPSAKPALEVSDLDSYPDEELGIPAFEALRSLKPTTIPALMRIAQRIRSAERQSLPPLARYKRSASGAPSGAFRELMDKGLITRKLTQDGFVEYELTDSGKTAARLLIATGSKPAWLNRMG